MKLEVNKLYSGSVNAAYAPELTGLKKDTGGSWDHGSVNVVYAQGVVPSNQRYISLGFRLSRRYSVLEFFVGEINV